MKRIIILFGILFQFLTNCWAQYDLVLDPPEGIITGNISNFHVFNDRLYFYYQNEIWSTDALMAGTRKLESQPYNKVWGGHEINSAGGKLYFLTGDYNTGPEVWCTDGTKQGTHLVKDIYPGNSNNFLPKGLTNINDTMYFIAYEPSYGYQVWKTDGTESGTVKVGLLNTKSSSRNILKIINASGRLLVCTFQVNGANFNFELYLYNQPNNSFSLIKSFTNSSFLGFDNYISFGDKLIFNMDDGINGNEIWVSDFTESGTKILKDINPGISSSMPGWFCLHNNNVYFTAINQATFSWSIWKTDGNELNTTTVDDVFVNNLNSSPMHLQSIDSNLYFTVYDALYHVKYAYINTDDKVNYLKTGYKGNIIYSQSGIFDIFGRKFFFTRDEGLFEIIGDTYNIVMPFDYNKNLIMVYGEICVFKNEFFFVGRSSNFKEQLWRTSAFSNLKNIIGDGQLIFPNPVLDRINFMSKLYDMEFEKCIIEIYDQAGRKIYTKSNLAYNENIDFSDNESGIYTIIIQFEDKKRYIEKFVKL